MDDPPGEARRGDALSYRVAVTLSTGIPQAKLPTGVNHFLPRFGPQFDHFTRTFVTRTDLRPWSSRSGSQENSRTARAGSIPRPHVVSQQCGYGVGVPVIGVPICPAMATPINCSANSS